jgi:hypothetical protein
MVAKWVPMRRQMETILLALPSSMQNLRDWIAGIMKNLYRRVAESVKQTARGMLGTSRMSF